MEYVTRFERVGQLEQAAKILNLLLARKFGQLPNWATDSISGASVESIERWTERLFRADSLLYIFDDSNIAAVRHFRPGKEDVLFAKELIAFEESIGKPYMSSYFWNSMQKQALKIFIILLNSRFGHVPDWATVRINEASVEAIEMWIEGVLHINNIEEFFENSNEPKHNEECVTMPVQLLTFCGTRG
ncbi:MAG: hypothetical protein HQM04_18370 [Magnetococcales bacterium]|nr:hypothetical protein [Magnetococcales bacterium]MBF0116994.1 hypothetical protein [Magnetococcales bacterium]